MALHLCHSTSFRLPTMAERALCLRSLTAHVGSEPAKREQQKAPESKRVTGGYSMSSPLRLPYHKEYRASGSLVEGYGSYPPLDFPPVDGF